MMNLLLSSNRVLSILLLWLFQTNTFAIKKPYIVYLGSHSHGLHPTSADIESVTNSHYNLLGSVLGSNELAQESIFYSYTQSINGFAANIEEDKATEIAKHPGVISIFESKGRKLHTTRSWEFLRLERDGHVPKRSLWKKARFGEDIIIGNLDTGVWPESKSFNDEGLGPVPSKWRGICDSGIEDKFSCNRKLIGARYFIKGYEAHGGKLNASHYTPRDKDSHGTHTLSTAAGSFVPGANVFGYGNGTAKGGCPKARVAAYKVCWPPIDGNECFDADMLAAYDAAVADGVDVLSVSLGGDPMEYLNDGISIGAFHAVKEGIPVISSAGNTGPRAGTVSNVAPWMLTVAASTTDREFISVVSLGNKMHLQGVSLSSKGLPTNKFYPLIYGQDASLPYAAPSKAILCKSGALDPKKVKGKIVVCLRGDNSRVDKGHQTLLAGAVGMILVNDESTGNDLIADAHVLPAAHISYKDGQTLLAYVDTNKTPYAHLAHVKTVLDFKPAPFMASFSSRGPNTIDPYILKPDVTAPGVSIIAAYSEAVGPTEQAFDHRRIPYNTETGTSMACPHVAGIVGLLKIIYPKWSPAAIRSAIMTTVRTQDNTGKPILTSSFRKANPFSYGAGHVQPNRAMDPGLVYDLTINDYLNYLCARGYNASVLELFTKQPHKCAENFNLVSFNYPSISVQLEGNLTITRRLKNVGTPGIYVARVKAPAGVSITIQPTRLRFDKIGEEKEFTMVIMAEKDAMQDEYGFGSLVWSDGKHYVRSPIAVKNYEAL